MLEHIHVTYKLYTSDFTIKKALKELDKTSLLSFDCETQSRYSIDQKKEAKELLKEN